MYFFLVFRKNHYFLGSEVFMDIFFGVCSLIDYFLGSFLISKLFFFFFFLGGGGGWGGGVIISRLIYFCCKNFSLKQ